MEVNESRWVCVCERETESVVDLCWSPFYKTHLKTHSQMCRFTGAHDNVECFLTTPYIHFRKILYHSATSVVTSIFSLLL